ncbi:MAG: response regulator [Polyangiaceae bacterium]|nr:response regulator [Polyangiaceae bacterium]
MSDWAASESETPPPVLAGSIFDQCRTILVVDDDPAFAEALAVSLASEQTQVALCATTAEAAREIEHNKPDVVVLDVSLPDGDRIRRAGGRETADSHSGRGRHQRRGHTTGLVSFGAARRGVLPGQAVHERPTCRGDRAGYQEAGQLEAPGARCGRAHVRA